jgi:hypothetical protein
MVLLCVTLCSFPASPQQIAQPPTFPDPKADLTKAAGITDIRSPHSSAFLLTANVHFRLGKQSIDGKYGLSWGAPNLYHEVFVFPGFRQDVVVSGDKIYRKRTTNFLPLPVYEWQSLLSAPVLWIPGKNTHVTATEVPSEWKGQSDISCVAWPLGESTYDRRIPSPPSKVTDCLTRADGDPVGIDIDDLTGHTSYHFSNYIPIGGQAFPSKITYEHTGDLTAEVDVETLKPVQAFVPDEFAPLAGILSETWCSQPKFSSDKILGAVDNSPDPGSGNIPNSPIFLYVHINTRGQADEVGSLESANPEAANRFINLVHGMTYPIATCGTTPISRELVLAVWPR